MLTFPEKMFGRAPSSNSVNVLYLDGKTFPFISGGKFSRVFSVDTSDKSAKWFRFMTWNFSAPVIFESALNHDNLHILYMINLYANTAGEGSPSLQRPETSTLYISLCTPSNLAIYVTEVGNPIGRNLLVSCSQKSGKGLTVPVSCVPLNSLFFNTPHRKL